MTVLEKRTKLEPVMRQRTRRKILIKKTLKVHLGLKQAPLQMAPPDITARVKKIVVTIVAVEVEAVEAAEAEVSAEAEAAVPVVGEVMPVEVVVVAVEVFEVVLRAVVAARVDFLEVVLNAVEDLLPVEVVEDLVEDQAVVLKNGHAPNIVPNADMDLLNVPLHHHGLV